MSNITADAQVDKIQKLLAKAERAGTEEEAAAFFGKAQELMTKWMIDDAVLAEARRKAGSAEKAEEPIAVDFKMASTYYHADIQLMYGICLSQGANMLTYGGSKNRVMLVGMPSDLDRVKILYASLQLQSARFARQEAPALDDKWSLYVWKRSFRMGFAQRVRARLDEQVRITMAQEAPKGSGTELAIIDKNKLVKARVDFLATGKARAKKIQSSYAGAQAGRQAGDRANLSNRGVSSNGKALGR